MRAWQLGAVITLIGFVIVIYATTYISILDPNFYHALIIGVAVFFLGIAILGIKLRQWVEHH